MLKSIALTALVTLTLAAPAAAQSGIAYWILLARPAPPPVVVPPRPVLPYLTPTYPVAPLPPLVVPPITSTSRTVGQSRYDTIQFPGGTVTCSTRRVGMMSYTSCY